ncbi:MAG TPA: ion channel [Usitatibacteraceae bacterium]|nr:ion channel [Usitatibacteraceae bacterium]
MFLTIALCLALVVATTLVHFEMLTQLSARLPGIVIASRLKLVVVMLTTFATHAIEIALYAVAIWSCIWLAGVGGLPGASGSTFVNCFYFSAETYTSLGFGDIVPSGSLRLLAGVETLNGLLLIGWSSSYIYLSMERFWDVAPTAAP